MNQPESGTSRREGFFIMPVPLYAYHLRLLQIDLQKNIQIVALCVNGNEVERLILHTVQKRLSAENLNLYRGIVCYTSEPVHFFRF